MTVADKLTAIADAKTAIVTAVQAKGGDLVDDPPMSEIAPAIDALPENGGGETGVVGVFKTAIYIDLGVKVIDFGGMSGSIREYFAYYSGVEELRGTQNVTSVRSNAFRACSSLTSASFPSVTSVESNAFYTCSSLTNASFPSATSVETYAFYNCSSLEVVFIGTEQTTVANLTSTSAFTKTPTTMRIVVPDTLVDAYKTAPNWATYADRIIGVTEWEATQ